MPKIVYTSQRFHGPTRDIIEKANAIAVEYAQKGYSMTLRQVYYQFVSRGWLENSDRSYKRLGKIINDARLAGEIDWHHLTDRTRFLRSENGWESPASIIEASAQQFRRELWSATEQQYRPEVWVEKDALVDVVGRACEEFAVPFMSCRGYVSQSEMWVAGRRMLNHFDQGLKPVVIHLGDHDPSGIDMTRDIQERLTMFAEQDVPVKRIALNMDQVERYNPPPNPAKLTDSRGSGYVERFGYESWELDALDPDTLNALIRDAVSGYVDRAAWEQGEAEDERMRNDMSGVASRWDDLMERWDDVLEVIE